ncbi:hypothetical protein LN996_21585 [Arthrobacter sp. AK01]|nr:hypothetical protein [Arthrobacter sp. AK01]MCP1413775.1 hypothetical protein [Paenarthrobacter sp. A20]
MRERPWLARVRRKELRARRKNELPYADAPVVETDVFDLDRITAAPWVGLHHRHEFLLHLNHEFLGKTAGD